MTADVHIRFLDLILDQYQLDIGNIIGIVCDNMETNKAISRRVNAPMIGCAAHRFNLAVKDFLKDHTDLILKVSVLMRKSKSVKRIALLKQNGCKWKPVPMHELRWSGIYRLFKRYKQLQPYLYLFESDCDVDKYIPEDAPANDVRRFPIVQYLPTPVELCSILDLLDDMELLELATKRLQQRDLTILSARDIFDEVLIDFPDLEHRLKNDAAIVESRAFETAVVKIMEGREREMPSDETEAAIRLQRYPDDCTLSAPRVHTEDTNSKRKRNKTQTKLEQHAHQRRRRSATQDPIYPQRTLRLLQPPR